MPAGDERKSSQWHAGAPPSCLPPSLLHHPELAGFEMITYHGTTHKKGSKIHSVHGKIVSAVSRGREREGEEDSLPSTVDLPKPTAAGTGSELDLGLGTGPVSSCLLDAGR